MSNKKFDDPTNVDVDVRWKKGSSKQADNHPRIIMDQEGNYYYAIPITHSDKKVTKGKDGKKDKTTNYYRLEKDPLGSDDTVYVKNHVEIKNKAAYGNPTKGNITKKDHNHLNEQVKKAKQRHKKKNKK
ncbi:MAG: hypothetical protein LUD22_03045 [Coprobacillus sp.]|nr:hypothetical protein [Coprobacillus sp.]